MAEPGVRARVMVVSLHTSPLDPPGAGDSGGMNVEIRSVAERLAERGVAMDVFTRCAGRGVPEVERVGPLTRVVQIPAGPCAPVSREGLPALVRSFIANVLDRAESMGPYDLVHAHYWLSGPAGRAAAERWDVPLVASFHTLGEVKNGALVEGEDPEPPVRIATERSLVGSADRIVAPTEAEAAHLAELYGADPQRIRVIPPGVDATWFAPRPAATAKAALGLEGHRVAMFLGRIQPHKGTDVALRAVAEAVHLDPEATSDLAFAVVGGPSGSEGGRFVDRLRSMARDAGIAERTRFFDPRPHADLAEIYAAADVLLMPSRSESFGIAALEAQACGVPVVAAAVGGLRSVVANGKSGFLVEGHQPTEHAEALLAVLRDREAHEALSGGARSQAVRFPWEQTADGVTAAYGELLPALAPDPVR